MLKKNHRQFKIMNKTQKRLVNEGRENWSVI